MVSVPPPQVIVDLPSFKVDYNTAIGYAPLVRHRGRHANIAPSIPAPRVLVAEDLFTKHERCYHQQPTTRFSLERGGEGRNIVELAMNEVLKNDKYVGFSHNTKEDSVYLIKSRDWDGIDSGSIGCERRPVPQGLTQKTSQKWKWHSLDIKK